VDGGAGLRAAVEDKLKERKKLMEKVKLGIIGCGATVRCMFGPILKYLENGSLVAVMDPQEPQAKWAKDMYGAQEIYTDLDQFLSNADVDAVIIGSPVYAHLDNAKKSADAGKHLLCEKPMARTLEECDEMIEACKAKNVTLMIAFMKRINKCFNLAKEMIDAGELGEVFQVRVDWSFYSRPGGWRDSLKTLGGVYQDHGSHAIDLCRWWLGEIETVSGEINIVDKEREVEDQAVAIYRHKSDAISFHHMTRVSHKALIELYEIMGTKKTLQIEFGPAWSFTSTEPFKMTLFSGGRQQTDVTPYNHGNLDVELKNNAQYLKELEHFCDCILNKKEPKTKGEDGRAAIEAINAVYLSSWTKKKINLPLTESVDLETMFRNLRSK